jgi:2-polyprenyl-6-methoxyphenol hydroxylase-like FAD-dependent oxidoreductase
MALDTDVLVIGAGPIGLINAWGIKQLNPNLKIVVLEKYADYQRSHTLVMQSAQLEAIMTATNSEQHPTLVALLKQLKADPHLRTNTLQKIFTQLAQDSGVEIKTEHEIQIDTIGQTINEEYPNVQLMIGADGTHSVVSRALFPDGNQVKHEFDFVLQLRFEIHGKEKAPGIRIQQFYQQMARKGLIANEYMGHFDQGKTPVTMQMMISKKDFLALEKATSKNPLKPYAVTKSGEHPEKIILPSRLKSFLTKYIQYKTQDVTEAGQVIDSESVRISVNEAPATYAREIFTKRGGARVVLEGDAALGLSYFKGLNAGLEASAEFLSTMSSVIQDSFKDKTAMDRQLNKYQTWFLKDFSPKKVKEVGQYSFWKIRSAMTVMHIARVIKNASMLDEDDDLDPVIADYFRYDATDPLYRASHQRWRPFPHREYDLVKFGQLDYVPLKHTAKKIAKIFIDFFTPYKSSTQLTQDFKQPFVGIANFFVGLGKIVVGVSTLNIWMLSDGLFHMLRASIELIMTPVTWLLKSMTRGIATLIHGGYKKIEDNKSLQDLAQHGLDDLNKTAQTVEKGLTDKDKTIYELLSMCHDIHRKFDKSVHRGQPTELGVEEALSYFEIRADHILDRQKLHHYFSLFAVKKGSADYLSPRSKPPAAP